MPSLAEYLKACVREAQANSPRLEAELAQMKTRKLAIENELQSASLAVQRASEFVTNRMGLDYYCPRCWIKHGRRSPITPIGSDDPHVDLFRCETCNNRYEIET